ncbi:MAG TPA: flavodoxin-dependent (E)-4-hydroxy-3-methylbut-2-enyl-diphosphate synthase, partial [Negativicutes bacterium]|nr:flavodoxin-dependent (E)-4-hydroxy-3-methylbut-2-enyl-diphosphate synthase [Negativicutes bacterium]
MTVFPERKTKRVLHVGNVAVGGESPISVQSMTTTKTSNTAATIAQIRQLQAAGCEIIRVAVPDMAAAQAVSAIKEAVDIPVVADIHFD